MMWLEPEPHESSATTVSLCPLNKGKMRQKCLSKSLSHTPNKQHLLTYCSLFLSLLTIGCNYDNLALCLKFIMQLQTLQHSVEILD